MVDNKVNVIMPMLGRGTRMDGIQDVCKPLMSLPDGDMFFLKSLSSLKNYDIQILVLVVLEEYYEEFVNLYDKISEVTKARKIIIIRHTATKNVIETFRIGFKYFINSGANKTIPLFCLDCDIYGEIPKFDKKHGECGRLFWFESDNPNKSYILTEEDSVVDKIEEKCVISNKAVFGAYLFEDFVLLYSSLLTDVARNFEYISDLFKFFLKYGNLVYASYVNNVINFGTIEEFKQYAKQKI